MKTVGTIIQKMSGLASAPSVDTTKARKIEMAEQDKDMAIYRISKDYHDVDWKAVVIAGGHKTKESAQEFLDEMKQFIEEK